MLVSPVVPVRFYYGAGLYDGPDGATAQLPYDEFLADPSIAAGSARSFRDLLLARGYDVIYREAGGGHDHLHWRATLAEGLMALIPAP